MNISQVFKLHKFKLNKPIRQSKLLMPLEMYRLQERIEKDLKTKLKVIANDVIPRARGEAEQVLQQAEAYKKEVVAKAEGEASRFLSIYTEYAKAKEVTQERMYLETMEQVLADINKIIIDKDSGSGVVPYLPLQELKSGTN